MCGNQRKIHAHDEGKQIAEHINSNREAQEEVRVERKWPKGLHFTWFITHRLFLDFGSLLYPLADRQVGRRWDGTRSADTRP